MPNKKQEDSRYLCVPVTKQPLGGPEGPPQPSVGKGMLMCRSHCSLWGATLPRGLWRQGLGLSGESARLWWPRTHAWTLQGLLAKGSEVLPWACARLQCYPLLPISPRKLPPGKPFLSQSPQCIRVWLKNPEMIMSSFPLNKPSGAKGQAVLLES